MLTLDTSVLGDLFLPVEERRKFKAKRVISNDKTMVNNSKETGIEAYYLIEKCLVYARYHAKALS